MRKTRLSVWDLLRRDHAPSLPPEIGRQRRGRPMNRSPDLRITAKRPSLLSPSPSPSGSVAGATWHTSGRPTPRLQWRDRVGLAPTSRIHRETSNMQAVYPNHDTVE